MIKRIIYLAVPIVIIIGTGLAAVQNLFSSFPPPMAVIEQLSPAEPYPSAIDLTESFFDDSGSMTGYYSGHYIKFLRILKSHIRERGKYRYHAFSDPVNIIEGDVWEVVENARFYRQNNTYFDKVLDSVLARIKSGDRTAKNFVIITDGIQDVSKIHDYSRIVNKISDLLDARLFFQVIAIKLPFNGNKYPEGGGSVSYEGGSPLFCFIFSYQHDFVRDLYKKLSQLNLPVEIIGFGNKNIHASVTQFRNAAKNRDGSVNTFKKFKDESPVTYIISSSSAGGTLSAKVALNLKGVNLDFSGFRQKTPEFCGKCLPVGNSANDKEDPLMSSPVVTVTSSGAEPLSEAAGGFGINYSLFFQKWDKGPETVACDLSLCHWLPALPPGWVDTWSSDCDNTRECFEGKTPFLKNIINPILNKSIRKYTFGYAVIRNL